MERVKIIKIAAILGLFGLSVVVVNNLFTAHTRMQTESKSFDKLMQFKGYCHKGRAGSTMKLVEQHLKAGTVRS